MTSPCSHPVALERLVEYERAELPAPDSEQIEAHLFACDTCWQRFEELSSVASGVREVTGRGLVPLGLTRSLEERLVSKGVRTRVFHVEPGASVPCGAAPADELMIVHLAADLAGVTHARLTLNDDAGVFAYRNDDVPLEAAGGTVRVAFPAALVRALPDMIVDARLELHGQEPRSVKYTLFHSHAGPPQG